MLSYHGFIGHSGGKCCLSLVGTIKLDIIEQMGRRTFSLIDSSRSYLGKPTGISIIRLFAPVISPSRPQYVSSIPFDR